jgi:hypothetical protein
MKINKYIFHFSTLLPPPILPLSKLKYLHTKYEKEGVIEKIDKKLIQIKMENNFRSFFGILLVQVTRRQGRKTHDGDGDDDD